jgi:uncharacterized protein (DUF305 family)
MQNAKFRVKFLNFELLNVVILPPSYTSLSPRHSLSLFLKLIMKLSLPSSMNFKRIALPLLFSGSVSFVAFTVTACQTNAAKDAGTAVAQTSPSPSGGMMMDHGNMGQDGMDHSNMDLGPKGANYDLLFIDAMMLHHQGAVNMAEEALQKSTRPEIKELAQAMIDAQQKEIAQMTEWRSTWYPNAPTTPMMYHAQMEHMMPMSEDMKASMMMSMDLGAADDQFDLRFINGMIPHHEGALVMAKDALAKSDRPEIKQLAQAILDSQQPEIDQMKQWKKEWYGQ